MNTTFYVHDDIEEAAKWYKIPLELYSRYDVYIMQEDRCVFVGSGESAIIWMKHNAGKICPSRFPLTSLSKPVCDLNLKQMKSEEQNQFIADVISRFSGDNLSKLQKHFVSLYGSDEMAQEKANSFAVGFGKACELICKELENGL